MLDCLELCIENIILATYSAFECHEWCTRWSGLYNIIWGKPQGMGAIFSVEYTDYPPD